MRCSRYERHDKLSLTFMLLARIRKPRIQLYTSKWGVFDEEAANVSFDMK